MEDFNGTPIEVGTKVFFLHKPSQPVIGRVSEINGKKMFVVRFKDVIKVNKKGQKELDEYEKYNNTLEGRSYAVNSSNCIVVPN